MRITGKYYADGNFVNVCTDNTLYTIAKNTGDDVLAAIDHATTVNEVARIMKKAREDYVYEE